MATRSPCSNAGPPWPRKPASPTPASSRRATSRPGPRPACRARSRGFLLRQHAPVRVTLPLSREHIAWMWQWYRSCDLATYAANRARMQRLAFYSRTPAERDHRALPVRIRPQPRLHGAAARREGSQAGAAGPAGAARRRRRVQGNRAPRKRARSSRRSTPTPLSSARCTCPPTRSATAASSRCCSRTRPRAAASCSSSTSAVDPLDPADPTSLQRLDPGRSRLRCGAASMR